MDNKGAKIKSLLLLAVGVLFMAYLIYAVSLTDPSVISPITEQNISGTLLLNATIDSGDNGDNISNVTFYFYNITGGLVFNVTATSEDLALNNTFNVSINTADTSVIPYDGRFNLTVNATNASDKDIGLVNSSVQNFTIDNTAPSVSAFTTPASGQNFTTGSTVLVNATVSDATAGIHAVLINVTLANGTKHANFPRTASLSTDTTTAYNATFTFIELGNGTHTFTVLANDTAGNLNNSETITATVDTSAPASITLNQPVEGSNESSATVRFNFTAVDHETDMLCNVTIDDTISQTNIATTNGTQKNVSVSSFSDGNHNWTVNCTNVVGLSTISALGNFTVDTVTPDVSAIAEPASGQNYSSTGVAIFVNTTVSDATTSVHGVLINISNGTSLSFQLAASNPNGNLWNATFNQSWFRLDGTYTVTIIANDTAGNVNNSETVSINVDVEGPVVNMTYPRNQTLVNDSYLRLNGTISDTMGLNACNYSINDEAAVDIALNYEVSTLPDHTWYVNTSVYSNGDNNITIKCSDNATSTHTTTSLFNFTVNDTAGPSVSSSSPSGEQDAGTTSVTLSVTVDEPAGLCGYASSNVTVDGTSAMTTSDNLTWTATISSLEDGTSYTKYVACNDTLGNNISTAASVSWSVAEAAATTTSVSRGSPGSTVSTTTQGSTASRMWSVATASGTNVMTIVNQNVPVSRVEFSVAQDAANVDMSVTALAAAPSQASTLSSTRKVYKHLEISAKNLADTNVKEAKIQFKVPQAWLTENTVGEDNVVLLRLEGAQWNELPTKKLLSGAQVSYEATSPGFSNFAISTKVTPEVKAEEKKAADEAQKPTAEPPAAEPETTPAVTEPEPVKAKSSVGWIIGVVIVVAGLLVYYFAVQKKK